MPRNYRFSELTWKGNDLYAGHWRIAAISPVIGYSGIWRAVLPDGTLTQMTNLTRAKDAAARIGLEVLKERTRSGRGHPHSVGLASTYRETKTVETPATPPSTRSKADLSDLSDLADLVDLVGEPVAGKNGADQGARLPWWWWSLK
jgi:hypothetical protein